MAPLTPPPKIKLSRLRDIGWSLWDPFALMPAGEKWDDEKNLHFADEYDSHLLYAAGQLRRGATDEEAVAYLVKTEAEYMALGERADSRERARATVKAINADDQLWTYPDDRNASR